MLGVWFDSPNQRLLRCYFEEDFSKERRDPGAGVGIVLGFPPTWSVHMHLFGFGWYAFQEMDSNRIGLEIVLSCLVLCFKLHFLLSTATFSHPYYNTV